MKKKDIFSVATTLSKELVDEVIRLTLLQIHIEPQQKSKQLSLRKTPNQSISLYQKVANQPKLFPCLRAGVWSRNAYNGSKDRSLKLSSRF